MSFPSAEEPHERRVRPAESLDLEQGERRPLRRHQPADRRSDARKALPVGKHPFQLYSLATPNGQKVTIMFEELLAAGHAGAEYDAWTIRIDGDQFGSGFVDVNPNSKIPALIDRSGPEAVPGLRVRRDPAAPGREVRRLPAGRRRGARRVACRGCCGRWAARPILGGGFGHFYAYAPTKIEYAIDRFAMEVKRQLDVLDRRLAEAEYLAGDDYTIADMAVWPWYGGMARGLMYGAGEFLDVGAYKHLQRWTKQSATGRR